MGVAPWWRTCHLQHRVGDLRHARAPHHPDWAAPYGGRSHDDVAYRDQHPDPRVAGGEYEPGTRDACERVSCVVPG